MRHCWHAGYDQKWTCHPNPYPGTSPVPTQRKTPDSLRRGELGCADHLSAEVRSSDAVMNDAEVQGAAVIQHEGLEVMFTLGTGLGCAVYNDGRLCTSSRDVARADSARTPPTTRGSVSTNCANLAPWSKRMLEVVEGLRPVFCWDHHLYVGGGNAGC